MPPAIPPARIASAATTFIGATVRIAVPDAPTWLRLKRPEWMRITTRYASPNAIPPPVNAVGIASEITRNAAIPPSSRSW